ncbi:MAG TPA: hypothetical protein VIM12_05625 [Noviherbaspirillum sp.]|jgi:uridine kinase|uniref:hypothetical protein n=1 Tax=Noviherbaspirillum sp. TaxID=1926288 RepID=UPI002F94C1CE
MRRVIAIAAPVGGGKSSLAAALARALDDAPVLRFDDFQRATRQSVETLDAWLAQGADFDLLEAPGLAARLEQLRRSEGQDGWVVFEMPLGRAWRATAAAIDLLVWLEVPADIALARKLRELAAAASAAPAHSARDALRWIDDYLAHYTATIHRVLAMQRTRVPAAADVVLDGSADTPTLLREVLHHMGMPA